MEVCHIETHADKKKRLEKEKREGKTRVKVKGTTSLKKADADAVADAVADMDLDELEVEEVDGVQECLPGKKRKAHTYGDKYRPNKKGRME